MEIGNVRQIHIENEMRESYIDYAMSVITQRALPDVRDGLKPVQRRILYAMDELGLRPGSAYKKSARIVGDVLGRYHPHGDSPVYEALVRLAQNFSMRYPLVDGQGNFGCFTGETKITLLDGTERTFEDLASLPSDHVFHVYSVDRDGRIVVGEGRHARVTRRDAELVEVTLDNGQTIRCTPDHRFLLRDGTYKQAHDLTADDSLMSGYFDTAPVRKGLLEYPRVFQPKTGEYEFVHHLADAFNARAGIARPSRGPVVRHHKNFNRWDNSPSNIERMAFLEHLHLHASKVKELWDDEEFRARQRQGVQRYCAESPEVVAERRDRFAVQNWDEASRHAKGDRVASALRARYRADWEARREISRRMRTLWADPHYRVRMSDALQCVEKRALTPDEIARVARIISEKSAAMWRDERKRGEIVEAISTAMASEEVRARVSAGVRRAFEDPACRARFTHERMSEMARALWQRDETRPHHREKIARQWSDPVFREAQGAGISRGNRRRVAENPAMMAELAGRAAAPLTERRRDPGHHRRVLRQRIARFAHRVIQEVGPYNFTPEVYTLRRDAGWIPRREFAPRYFDSFDEQVDVVQKQNHRVTGVRRLDEHADVYDITVDEHHNFLLSTGVFVHNSVDGDPPAAMRYTEARLARVSEELLADIDKDTVDFRPNFDGSLRQPAVLPARLPNLLVNGAAGIAVGMATNIPPHNLGEIVDAIVLMINRYGETIKRGIPFDLVWARVMHQPIDDAHQDAAVAGLKKAERDALLAHAQSGARARTMTPAEWRHALLAHVDHAIDVTPDELMEIVKGPDFPTAGVILGTEGIKQAFTTGHGRVLIRALAHTEELKGSRTQIVVTEIPYQINKASLIERIADLVREKRIEGISDLRDESDRQGMRIVVELKRDANPRLVLNQLYKLTAMQSAFSINMLALVDGAPRVLTLKMMLQQYLNFRRQVITRRTRHDLEKARQRAHILEGLRIALDHLDEVIAIIRRAADAEAARDALIKRFTFSDVQAQAILDMQLRRLAALERKKLADELKEVRATIARLEDLLANPVKILYVVRDELVEVKQRFGDARRTRIVPGEKSEFTEEDLIPNLDIVIISTVKDYVKRMPAESYQVRRSRGGITTTFSREDDAVQHVLAARMHDAVLLFTTKGRVFQVKAHELPDAEIKQKGLPLVNLVQMEQRETVTAIVAVPKFVEGRYMLLVTRRGEVKRVHLLEYQSARSNGLVSMTLPENDELIWARLTNGDQEVLLTTKYGQAIRFNETDIRPSGRPSGGVRGIKLAERDEVLERLGLTGAGARAAKGDEVVGVDLIEPDGYVLIVSTRGYGKRIPLAQFPVQGRGGGGVRSIAVGQKTGPIAAARVVRLPDEVMLATREGMVARTAVGAVPQATRQAQGAPIVQLGEKDQIAAVARLRGGDGSGTPGPRGEIPGLEEAPSRPTRGRSGGAPPPPAAPDGMEESADDGPGDGDSSAPTAEAAAPARRPRAPRPATPAPETPKSGAPRQGAGGSAPAPKASTPSAPTSKSATGRAGRATQPPKADEQIGWRPRDRGKKTE